jgi:AbrB family looped-hinge helix DNA binding protein
VASAGASRSPVVILMGMTHKVGPKGQVVLPKPLRYELGIEPGDDVLFEREGEGIRVWKAPAGEDLWGSLPPAEIDPLETLMEDKRGEREREDRRLGEWGR